MALQLQIEGLSKTYANGVAAKDVSLAIPTGMFGLLGPNGAGKSTLMRTIATLQEPDTGTIRLDGIDVLQSSDEVRQLLGYLPQADFEPAEPDLEDVYFSALFQSGEATVPKASVSSAMLTVLST
jgi:ABC-type multidrug transport system ATPase subunit